MSGGDPALEAVAAAYEGFEASFPDEEAVRRYRESMLERSREQVDAIAARLPDRPRVLEVATGNGRLLMELHRRGLLRGALGIDIAASRVEFARAWAADEGADPLRFEVGDALAVDLPERGFDAAVCVTGALAYFGAATPRRDSDLLERMVRALGPGGVLCLEVYPHPDKRRLLEATGGHVRTWYELDADDPWRFYLSEMWLEDGVLTHEKTFIHRHDGRVDAGRRESLYLYTPEELHRLLEAAGLSDVELLEGWSGKPYAGGELLVAFARL